jgi:hypothetical protein
MIVDSGRSSPKPHFPLKSLSCQLRVFQEHNLCGGRLIAVQVTLVIRGGCVPANRSV